MTAIPALKPSDRRQISETTAVDGPRHPKVTGAGNMTPDGYVPENDDYFDMLTEVVVGRRQGRDPMTIPLEVLMTAGHGPRETRRVVGAMGDIPMPEGIKSYKDLRRHCLTCAETIPEIRHCTIIDCPIWPYRMGRNPHNPKRGINPFKVVDAIASRA